MTKYKKNSLIVNAFQFTETDKIKVYRWAKEIQYNIEPSYRNGKPVIIVPTPEGEMICGIDDWLIEESLPDGQKKIYPLNPEIFDKTFKPINSGVFDSNKYFKPINN